MESWMAGVFDRMRETQHEHTAILKEILAELRRLHLKPPPPERDLHKHLPILWRLVVAGMVLLGILKLPPEEAARILLAVF